MMSREQYQEAIRPLEEKILLFLRTFEDVQENMHFGKIPEAQGRVQDTLGDFFETALSNVAGLEPPEELAEFHAAFCAALTHLNNCSTAFLGGAPGPNFGGAFVNSRFFAVSRTGPFIQPARLSPNALPILAVAGGFVQSATSWRRGLTM